MTATCFHNKYRSASLYVYGIISLYHPSLYIHTFQFLVCGPITHPFAAGDDIMSPPASPSRHVDKQSTAKHRGNDVDSHITSPSKLKLPPGWIRSPWHLSPSRATASPYLSSLITSSTKPPCTCFFAVAVSSNASTYYGVKHRPIGL